MAKFEFDFEWIDPGGAKGPELRATWARLQLNADGQNLTRLVDLTSRSIRTGVFVPLYPLAEWFVTQWWFLLHEIERRGSTESRDYDARHSLRAAGEGFALPAVSFTPTGSAIQVEWTPVHLEHHHVEFPERGVTHLATDEFRQAVIQFVSAVLGRLRQFDIVGTVLEQEFEAIKNATSEEEEFCAAAGALGLDPYALTDSQAAAIVSTATSLPSSIVPEFFAVAEYQQLQKQASQVLHGISSSRANTANLESLKRLKREHSIKLRNTFPWTQGYDFARTLREQLGLDGIRLSSVSALGEALHVDVSDLRQAVKPVLSRDAALDAVVDVNDQNSPGFALAARNEPTTLFTLCRALFEYLVSPEDQTFIVTRSRSERQKRNRAFAAEFLVPAAALRDALPRELLSDEDIDDIAERFGVSSAVIRHQVENHRLARVVDQ